MSVADPMLPDVPERPLSEQRVDQPVEPRPGKGALKRVFANAGKLLGGKVAAGLISVIYLGLVTRGLGPSNYGVLVLISFYTLLVGSFVVLQGWHTIVLYGGARLMANDREGFQRLFSFTVRVELLSGLVAMIASALLSQWAGRWFGWPPEDDGVAAMYALAIAANMHNTPAGVLNLYKRFDLLSIQQVANPIVRLIGASVAWWSDGGLKAYLIAWLLGSIAEGIADWALAIGEMRRRGVLKGAFRSPAGITREHPGIWKFLLADNMELSLTDAVNRITPLAVGAVLNPAAVGTYHLALRIGMVLQQPIYAIGRTVYPELAVLAERGERYALRRLALRTGLIALGAGLVAMLIFVAFGTNILLAIGGPGFEGAYGVLLMIAFARTIHLLGFPFNSALISIGKPNVNLLISFTGVVLLTPVLYALLLHFQIIGAGLHAITYAVLTVGAAIWSLARSGRTVKPAAQ